MKKAIVLFAFLPLVFIVNAQKSLHKKAPLHTKTIVQAEGVEILKFFYIAYMAPYVDGSVLSDLSRKQSLLRRTYCTPRCQARYLQLMQESDGDPFIKALDCDVAAIKSLEVTNNKDPKHPNDYTVTYTAADKITINITMVNENGKLKIDNFN